MDSSLGEAFKVSIFFSSTLAKFRIKKKFLTGGNGFRYCFIPKIDFENFIFIQKIDLTRRPRMKSIRQF